MLESAGDITIYRSIFLLLNTLKELKKICAGYVGKSPQNLRNNENVATVENPINESRMTYIEIVPPSKTFANTCTS